MEEGPWECLCLPLNYFCYFLDVLGEISENMSVGSERAYGSKTRGLFLSVYTDNYRLLFIRLFCAICSSVLVSGEVCSLSLEDSLKRSSSSSSSVSSILRVEEKNVWSEFSLSWDTYSLYMKVLECGFFFLCRGTGSASLTLKGCKLNASSFLGPISLIGERVGDCARAPLFSKRGALLLLSCGSLSNF